MALFSPEFEQRLEASKSAEARASEMEHAIRDEIHVHLEEDPAFYRSLRERLEQIVADYKARRIDAAKQRSSASCATRSATAAWSPRTSASPTPASPSTACSPPRPSRTAPAVTSPTSPRARPANIEHRHPHLNAHSPLIG
ncbi:MAG: hypothetical protein IPK80_25195 [Nannocystis sp.]|nr:hypothetical protein [Nannocystis sp.]